MVGTTPHVVAYRSGGVASTEGAVAVGVMGKELCQVLRQAGEESFGAELRAFRCLVLFQSLRDLCVVFFCSPLPLRNLLRL